jgi:uncharacterized protein YodC (DUF2158 family)
MAKNFKAGDLVQLKSGGPIMTVRNTDLDGPEYVLCQWFNGKKLEEGTFPVISLQEPPPAKP